MHVVCTTKVRHLKYESLRRSLEQTILLWPHAYEHKIIGKNSPVFQKSIEDFERSFRVKRKSEQLSKNSAYYSLTYQISANDVDEIISLWVASEQVKDCVAVL